MRKSLDAIGTCRIGRRTCLWHTKGLVAPSARGEGIAPLVAIPNFDVVIGAV